MNGVEKRLTNMVGEDVGEIDIEIEEDGLVSEH